MTLDCFLRKAHLEAIEIYFICAWYWVISMFSNCEKTFLRTISSHPPTSLAISASGLERLTKKIGSAWMPHPASKEDRRCRITRRSHRRARRRMLGPTIREWQNTIEDDPLNRQSQVLLP